MAKHEFGIMERAPSPGNGMTPMSRNVMGVFPFQMRTWKGFSQI